MLVTSTLDLSWLGMQVVHRIRSVLAPRQLKSRPGGRRLQKRLHAVVEHIKRHLGASPTLTEMAAVARLGLYHFARQFKQATGLSDAPGGTHPRVTVSACPNFFLIVRLAQAQPMPRRSSDLLKRRRFGADQSFPADPISTLRW